jgi:hypothetical protein
VDVVGRGVASSFTVAGKDAAVSTSSGVQQASFTVPAGEPVLEMRPVLGHRGRNFRPFPQRSNAHFVDTAGAMSATSSGRNETGTEIK